MNPKIIHQRKRLLNLTNAQLAEKAGITLSNLEKIMSGANPNPSIATLSAIADVIGCTLDDFEQSNPESDVEQRFYIRTDTKLFQRLLQYQKESNCSTVNAAASNLLFYAMDHKILVKLIGDPMYREPQAVDGIFFFVADLLRNSNEKDKDILFGHFLDTHGGLLNRSQSTSDPNVQKSIQSLFKQFHPDDKDLNRVYAELDTIVDSNETPQSESTGSGDF